MQRRSSRHRHGFTFAELLVILSILGVGVYFASVGTTGQNSYYGLRGDVERIVSAIQRACIQSASRGEVLVRPGVAPTAGVTFFRDQMGPSNQLLPGAPSFVNWFDDLAFNPEARLEPVAPLGAAGGPIQNLSKALRLETILTRAYVPLVPVVPLTDGAVLRYRAGRMDVFRLNGTVGGGILGQLAANFNQVDSPMGIGSATAWTFDVVNLNAGWVRIRCLSGGFVEVSGVNPVGNAVPTNVAGGVF